MVWGVTIFRETKGLENRPIFLFKVKIFWKKKRWIEKYFANQHI
jgi:hypothetical protein